ncbi:MAG: AAA family ATPase [Chthoniobacterales bacterium]|nr:AAA family ATPase [Chthoniobacterales bacterium]
MQSLPDQLRGVKVFPIVPGGKLPATTNGWKEASDDPEQIAAWQRINPDFNWAVACGLSGIFVFDIDPAGLDWWAKLLERDPAIRVAVDNAFQVRTPRGGLHIYFRGEGPSTASRIAEGIDTRGGILKDGEIISGGYVVLPGSRTDKGSYEALPGGTVAPLPSYVAAIVPERKKTDTLGLDRNPDADKPRNVQWAIDLLKGYVANGRVSVQGAGGNNTLFQVAASILDKAISPGMAFDLMGEHWNPACSPPWDEWELEAGIRNAAEYGEDTKGGVKGFQANEDAFAAFVGQEFEPPPRRSRFAPMWLHDARKDVRPAKWLIPGFVPDTGAGILYGLSGTYKTFLALDWALCLAHGIAGQWNAPPVKHTVLFLAGESSYALRSERVDAWCEKHNVNPDDADFIIVPGVPNYSDTEGWQEIRDGLLAMNAQPSFIVIDTLTRMMTGMDENSSNDGKLILKHCEEMAAHYGAFVLGIGHTGKDQSKGLRGTQVLIDNAEAVHSLKKTQNGTSMRVVKLKEVDIPPQLFYFDVEKIGASIVLNRTENEPDAIEQKAGIPRNDWASVEEVSKILEGCPDRSTSTAIVVQTITSKYNVPHDKVRAALLKNNDLTFLRPNSNIYRIPKQEYDL